MDKEWYRKICVLMNLIRICYDLGRNFGNYLNGECLIEFWNYVYFLNLNNV